MKVIKAINNNNLCVLDASWLGPIGRTPNPARLTLIPVFPNNIFFKIKSSEC